MYNECLRRVGRATVHRIEPLDDIEMGLATKTMPIRQEMSKISKLLHYQNDSIHFAIQCNILPQSVATLTKITLEDPPVSWQWIGYSIFT